MTRTITARSTPYRETARHTYTCERCGIEREVNRHGRTICKDCRDDAIRFGWITVATYECPRCGGIRQGQEREMCGTCKSNVGRYRKATT